MCNFLAPIAHSTSASASTSGLLDNAALIVEAADDNGKEGAMGGKSSFLPPAHSFKISAHSIHPCSRASISGVTLCLSGLSGTAPLPSKMRTTPRWPFAAAKCRGVDPLAPRARLREPCPCPLWEGAWVCTSVLNRRGRRGAFTSAPCWIRHSTTTSLPPAQAACNGRTPLRTELTGWPWVRA